MNNVSFFETPEIKHLGHITKENGEIDYELVLEYSENLKLTSE